MRVPSSLARASSVPGPTRRAMPPKRRAPGMTAFTAGALADHEAAIHGRASAARAARAREAVVAGRLAADTAARARRAAVAAAAGRRLGGARLAIVVLMAGP